VLDAVPKVLETFRHVGPKHLRVTQSSSARLLGHEGREIEGTCKPSLVTHSYSDVRSIPRLSHGLPKVIAIEGVASASQETIDF